MTREEIINGLKMSIDLMLFDPTTGEVKEPHQLNDMDRTSYEAFKGAMEILAQPQTNCIAKITLSKEQIQDAVEKAKAITPKGTVCLLSPASASYGFFKNFEERGDFFQKYVKEL